MTKRFSNKFSDVVWSEGVRGAKTSGDLHSSSEDKIRMGLVGTKKDRDNYRKQLSKVLKDPEQLDAIMKDHEEFAKRHRKRKSTNGFTL